MSDDSRRAEEREALRLHYIEVSVYIYVYTYIPQVPASSQEDTLAKCQLCHFSIWPPVDGKF